jgi:hypothetical protein
MKIIIFQLSSTISSSAHARERANTEISDIRDGFLVVNK